MIRFYKVRCWKEYGGAYVRIVVDTDNVAAIPNYLHAVLSQSGVANIIMHDNGILPPRPSDYEPLTCKQLKELLIQDGKWIGE